MEPQPVLTHSSYLYNLSFINEKMKHGSFRQILVVGSREKNEKLIKILFPEQRRPQDVKNFLLSNTQLLDEKKICDYLEKVLREEVVDEIYIVMSPEIQNEIDEILHSCKLVGRKTTVIDNDSQDDKWKVVCHPPNSTRFKRFFDILFSSLVLLFILPLIMFISFAVKIDSPKGPVFFVQERVGIHGRRFKVLKFRTMIPYADTQKDRLRHLNEMDGPVFKITNDPRITRVGRFLRKTSLDELPQFINVLKGDMSVVGPRPLPTKEAVDCDLEHQIRHSIKPGITCIWQTSGRNNLQYEEWKQMDLEYTRNSNFLLDLKLIVKTFCAVVGMTGK